MTGKHILTSILCVLSAVLALVISPSAWAACASPTGSAGEIIYNADDHIMQYCDNTDWISMGQYGAGGTSDCSSPARAPGTLLYNQDKLIMQYCNGANWVGLSAETSLESGLVGYWKLDEGSGTTTADSSGTGNNGTLTNMDPGTDWVSGYVDGALDFDGSNDYVSVPDDPSLDITGSFTLSAWIKPSSVSAAWATIVVKGYAYLIQLNYDKLNIAIHNGSWSEMATDSVFSVDTWYHVVGVYDDTTSAFTIYIDGREIKTGAASFAPDADNTSLSIGQSSQGAERFPGIIDDVRVYNRALSASEAALLFRTTSNVTSAPSTGLVAHWPFDDASGTIATDATGNGSDGTLTNGPQWTTAGMLGGAIDFNGDSTDDDYVLVPYQAINEPTVEMTYSAWIYLRTNSWGRWIISRNRGTNGFIVDNTHFLKFFLYTGGTTHSLNSPNAFPLNVWTHVAGVYDGSEVALYMNGKKVDSEAASGGQWTPHKDIEIGWDSISNYPAEDFDGYIDDVRIYDTGLTASEIQQLYFYRELGSCTNPTGRESSIIYNEDEDILQYCNGIEWVAIGKVPPPPCGHYPSPGDICEDSAVYVGSIGSKRLYVTQESISTGISWNDGTSSWTTTNATSMTDGAYNTNILANLADAGAPYKAADLCESYAGCSPLGGCPTDWYLPSRDELVLVMQNRAAINSSIGGPSAPGWSPSDIPDVLHWSSSETGNSWASSVNGSGTISDNGKNNPFDVRCVRSE